ncbi:hypothetical protein ACE1CI_17210 [Aerosakkonemataceae cyanobacterium BLCC-F50]|uniref:Transposase n=1 Tax=Floridaenema flaviceps BLCC-F50 TaxID=3153642 RepID=A0ABV4XUM9_9CYAN
MQHFREQLFYHEPGDLACKIPPPNQIVLLLYHDSICFMYLTQKNQIRELNKSEFVALRELCRLSKNLYNVGLYAVRQYFFQEQKHLRYESAYHLCKTNENYKLLNTDIAQQTLKVVDRTFKSFYGLISAVKNGSYHQKVKLPDYLPKYRYFLLNYIEQEESYTSKASAIDGDEIPIYNADNPKEYQFSGKRIKRGLYRTKEGYLVNADLNGSLNAKLQIIIPFSLDSVFDCSFNFFLIVGMYCIKGVTNPVGNLSD